MAIEEKDELIDLPRRHRSIQGHANFDYLTMVRDRMSCSIREVDNDGIVSDRVWDRNGARQSLQLDGAQTNLRAEAKIVADSAEFTHPLGSIGLNRKTSKKITEQLGCAKGDGQSRNR